MDERAAATLQAANEISSFLTAANIPHAVIGAMALAVHGYTRATADFDFGTFGDPFDQFRELARQLEAANFQVEHTTPDAEDPLGGVITINRDGIDPIQLVNFFNPVGMHSSSLGRDAIASASAIGDLSFRIVDVPYLILLKLYAGGLQSRSDALQLLLQNPQTDLEELRSNAIKYGLDSELNKLLLEL